MLALICLINYSKLELGQSTVVVGKENEMNGKTYVDITKTGLAGTF